MTQVEAITPDDLAARRGEEIGTSPWIEIDQEMIDRFAEVCGDDQFIHVDPVRAADTPFGGTIAHGFLTVSLLSIMARTALPQIAGTRMGINYGIDRLRFPAPVRAGAKVRGRFILAECDLTTLGEVRLVWDVTVEIEGGPKPALAARWLNRRYLETPHGAA
ncbi:MAG: MaoC family dehydratase [Jannaschia sp.]